MMYKEAKRSLIGEHLYSESRNRPQLKNDKLRLNDAFCRILRELNNVFQKIKWIDLLKNSGFKALSDKNDSIKSKSLLCYNVNTHRIRREKLQPRGKRVHHLYGTNIKGKPVVCLEHIRYGETPKLGTITQKFEYIDKNN